MAGAAAAADDAPAVPPAAAAPRRKGAGIGLLLVAVIVSAGASAGISWFVSRQAVQAAQPAEAGAEAPETATVPSEPANYFALEPAFVVNVGGERAQRFLQVQIELMSRDPKTVEQAERHAPRIRSQLLLLLGQQQPEILATRAGKEQLQAEVLAEVQSILKAETGSGDVEAVYFTSFVMQ